FINGMLEGHNGKVGTTRESSDPGYSPFNVYMQPVTDTLDITIHVSNFDHRRGGFWKVMNLGEASMIHKRSVVKALIVYLSLGFLLSFILFFLSFYLIFPRNRTPIFFALMLAGIFLRLVATNFFPFHLLFGSSWLWLIRVEYLSTYITFCFGMWYLYSLYPSGRLYKLTMVNSVMSAGFILLILFTGVRLFSWSMIYLQPVAVLFLIFYLVASFQRMVKNPEGNILFFAALLLFILALLNDIFLSNSWPAISGGYLLHFSALFLVFVQAVTIIRKWVEVYIDKEHLLAKNEYMKTNLENLVKERTRTLDERNADIKAKSKEITLQNDELQREIDFKNRFFSILAHDLRDPLSSINLYLDMAANNIPLIKRKDLLDSTAGIARSVLNLVENLLFWGRSQGKQLSLNPQKCDIHEVLKDALKLLGETARQKGINLFVVTSNTTEIECDRQMLMIILRNLISNAIKFSHRGNDVMISTENNETGLVIKVEDRGIGMSEEQIEAVFSDDLPESTYGTGNEKGTGLGLKLCSDIVRLHQGNMTIEGREGGGTRFTVTLPLIATSKK
ncbi:MAG TPA: ATP-binding protein, partial [Bacteroidales bacterium]|nr:ATP-binding protein [Bacteroidales bacterium]